MAKDDKQHYDGRVRERARKLWVAEGRPAGRDPADGHEAYLEKAREALAIEDNAGAATERPEAAQARLTNAEPVESIENQGEFPGRSDQGVDSPAVPRRGRR